DLPPGRTVGISVNVSARQLAHDELIDHVRDALSDSGLDPAALVLAMTETAVVGDLGAPGRRLHQLRPLGVRRAIDDFGPGYSSLSHLRQFPMDIIKIDRSFVAAITDDDDFPPIVRGLLDLGRALGLQTIAEGVELDVQRGLLRDQDCRLAQGYLFAR